MSEELEIANSSEKSVPNLKQWLDTFHAHPVGTVHVGAHAAEERHLYQEMNLEPVLWIEAHPELYAQITKILQDFPKQVAVEAALWDEPDKELNFYVAGKDASSSSLLKPKLISASHPEVWTYDKIVVQTQTLYNLLINIGEPFRSCELLCLDVQGAEWNVLVGAIPILDQFPYIYLEVSTRELYRDGALFDDVRKKLEELGYVLVASHINVATSWGDALFIVGWKYTQLEITPDEHKHTIAGKKFPVGTMLRRLLIQGGLSNRFVSRLSKILRPIFKKMSQSGFPKD
jgi:FkbM family methyltransferase